MFYLFQDLNFRSKFKVRILREYEENEANRISKALMSLVTLAF